MATPNPQPQSVAFGFTSLIFLFLKTFPPSKFKLKVKVEIGKRRKKQFSFIEQDSVTRKMEKRETFLLYMIDECLREWSVSFLICCGKSKSAHDYALVSLLGGILLCQQTRND